jgi:hypothetical protein
LVGSRRQKLKLRQFPPFENKPPRPRPRVFEPEKVKSKYYKYRDAVSKERRRKPEKQIKFAIRTLEKRGEFAFARRVAIFLNKPSYTNRREVAEIVFTYRKLGKPQRIINKP